MGIFSIFHNMRFVMGLMGVNDFLGWSDGCDLMVLFSWAGIVFFRNWNYKKMDTPLQEHGIF